MADCLLSMAQSGQYNYERCVKRGESGAASLALYEFVKNAVSTVYLLNNAYEPFYKWAVELIAEKLASELRRQGLSNVGGSTLHAHAYSVGSSRR